jgi:hypothetical protein
VTENGQNIGANDGAVAGNPGRKKTAGQAQRRHFLTQRAQSLAKTATISGGRWLFFALFASFAPLRQKWGRWIVQTTMKVAIGSSNACYKT